MSNYKISDVETNPPLRTQRIKPRKRYVKRKGNTRQFGRKKARDKKNNAKNTFSPILQYLNLIWSDSKSTSFYLNTEMFKDLDEFAKLKKTSKSEITSFAIFEFITMTDSKDVDLFSCKKNGTRIKTSLRLPVKVLDFLQKYAGEKRSSESEIINASICNFLSQHKV